MKPREKKIHQRNLEIGPTLAFVVVSARKCHGLFALMTTYGNNKETKKQKNIRKRARKFSYDIWKQSNICLFFFLKNLRDIIDARSLV